jgi:hypothetical protein
MRSTCCSGSSAAGVSSSAFGGGVDPDLAHAFYAAVTSPKQELWLRSQGQIDFYDNPKLITPATDAVASFC